MKLFRWLGFTFLGDGGRVRLALFSFRFRRRFWIDELGGGFCDRLVGNLYPFCSLRFEDRLDRFRDRRWRFGRHVGGIRNF